MYMRKIKKPYKKAFLIPTFLLCAFFVKKETVSGIIGKIQGIINEAKPPKKPKKNIDNNPLDFFSSFTKEEDVLFSVSGFSTFILGTKILLLEVAATFSPVIIFTVSDSG